MTLDDTTTHRDSGVEQHRETTPIPIAARVQRRLEMQGFTCRPDPAFEAIVPWLRLAPALTTTVVVVGTVLASPIVLVALAFVTAGCAASRRHPFDHLYNHGIRAVTGTPPLPRNEPPRRFACAMATAWSLLTAAAFWSGHPVLGYVLGGSLVALGGLVATTHFCFGSLVYQSLVRRGVGQ